MRRRDGFDGRSLLGAIAVHAVVIVLALWSSLQARPPLEFITYQVELVSPPPAAQAPEPEPPKEELVVEAPDPTPPEPEEEKPEPVVEEQPKPPPPKPKPTPTPPKEEPKEEEKPAATTEEPKENAAESGEDLNVRMEGLRRDFPEYYGNIIRQIHRCFRWTAGGNWETTVYFVIRPDGSVTGLDFVKKSGNAQFDFEALGAVECAGKGRFGALPEELPWDQLPIQFKFRPGGGGGTPPQGIPSTETATNR